MTLRWNEYLRFGLKQARASAFGGVLLASIIATRLTWAADLGVARYDFLFAVAIATQAVFLWTGLETWEECRSILVFHLLGTLLELHKTHSGAWTYPEDSSLRLAQVPLFAGFLYASVGSYIARVWRLFEFGFTQYPKPWITQVLSAVIYLHFFARHMWIGWRWLLLVLTLLVFGKTVVTFRPYRCTFQMPLFAGFALVAVFLWIAENIGTRCAIWIYPEQQAAWHPVAPTKIASWFLLMIISFVLVARLQRTRPATEKRFSQIARTVPGAKGMEALSLVQSHFQK